MDPVALAECTSEELGNALGQVHALVSSAQATLLELIRACEERKVWAEDGCCSIQSWVAMQLGVAWRTAAEMVRVARSLEERPAIASAFASGALSWDKVRALSVFTTPSSDADWAEAAPETRVSTLERAAKANRERDEGEAAASRAGQKLLFRDDRD